MRTVQICSLVALTVAATACISLPAGRLEALNARKPFTVFDPSGVWIANGTFVGWEVANQRVTVQRDGVAYQVAREVLHDGVYDRITGVGFVDGDRLFVGYGPTGFTCSFELYDVPSAAAQFVDGIYTNGYLNSGVVRLTAVDEPHFAQNRLSRNYTAVGGNEGVKWKQKLLLNAPVGAPDVAYWAKWWGGGEIYLGVALVDGDKLGAFGLRTQLKDFTYGVVEQATGFTEVAVYKFHDGVLDGTVAIGNTRAASMNQTAPRIAAERWVRGQ
jgi:hypothetical protein